MGIFDSNIFDCNIFDCEIVVGGDSARYYYMKPRIEHKNRKDLLLSIKNLLEALK